MALTPKQAYALSKKFTEDTVEGAGAIKGKNCTISAKTPITGGTRITFQWTLDSGEVRTDSIDVIDGIDAEQIVNIESTADNRLKITMSDTTTYTTDVIPTIKGDNGYSPSATATRDTDGIILTVRDKSGTTQAKANDGFSPVVTMRRNATNTGVELTITDANGTHTQIINDGSATASVDYANVLNKPQINGVEVSGNKTLAEYGISIPTKNSQLLNDKGYITAEDLPTVDTALSSASQNPISNKAATDEIRATQSILNDTIVDVGANTDAIAILNGNATVNGSVDKKISDALANLDRLTKQIVAELPPIGSAVENVIYLVPNSGGTAYEQWTIVDDGSGGKDYAQLGSTDVDLTGYYTSTQADSLLNDKQATITGAVSTVTSLNLSTNKVVVSDANGKVSASSITTTELEALDDITGNVQAQLDGKQDELTFDLVPTDNSENMVKSGGIKEALDEKQDVLTFDNAPTENSNNVVKSGGVYTALEGKNKKFQYDELPIASVDLLDEIYQYVGTTTATYTNGLFYKCVLNEDTATYEWQPQSAGDSNVQADWEETDTTSDSYIQNKPTLGTASEKDSTDVIRPNSHDLAESGSTYNAIIGAVSSIYEPRIPITCAELTSSLLIPENIGNVYKVTDSGTTTADFMQGADIPIDIGDSIGILKVGATDIKFNLMGETMDLHDLQPKQLATPLTIDGQQATTVEGALDALNRQVLYADNPIGTILPYGGSTVPTGWLLCDGSAVSRTTYADLFGVIGTSFGSGNGSTTFNLPDMRESVPKGAGLTGKTVGAHLDADGLAVGEFLDDQLQAHTHSNKTGTSTPGQDAWTMFATNKVGTAVEQTNNGVVGRFGATTEVKSVGVNYIIKAKMVGVPSDFLAKVDEAVEEATVDAVTDGDMRPVTSNAVADYAERKLITVSADSSNYSISGQVSIEITIDFEAVGYSPIGITRLQNNHGSYILLNGYWWTKDSNNHNILHIYNLSLSASTSFDDLQCLAIVNFKHD